MQATIKPNSKKAKRLRRFIRQKRANNRRKARRTRILRGVRVNRRFRRLPAAFTKNFNKEWKIISQDATSMTVSGRDLIYQIPDTLATNVDSPIMTVITANPAYWIGTRMANMAAAYQNYRPIALSVTYVPHCGSTQVGTVIGGTLWQQAPSENALQQTLQTSNGGFMTQAFMTTTKSIILGSNLQKNLYQVGGDLADTSNPFIFIAIAQGCYNENKERIVPGYFYISYTYVLKNPIGTNALFTSTGLIKAKDISNSVHRTVVMASPQTSQYNPNTIPLGTQIQVDTLLPDEEEEDQEPYNAYFIEGTEVEIPDDCYVWEFANTPIHSTQPPEPEPAPIETIPIYYNSQGVGNGQYKQFSWGALLYILPSDPDDKYIPIITQMRIGSNGNTNWRYKIDEGLQYYVVSPQSERLDLATWNEQNAFLGCIYKIECNYNNSTIELEAKIDRSVTPITFTDGNSAKLIKMVKQLSINPKLKNAKTLKKLGNKVIKMKRKIKMKEDEKEVENQTKDDDTTNLLKASDD